MSASARAAGAMPAAHFALVLLICLAWGGNFLAAAYSLQHFPPLLFTALRLGIVLLCLLPFLKPIPAGQRLRLALIALNAGALHFGLNFWALRSAGGISGVAIALQSYIPMSALLAVWLLGERMRWRTAFGIALAFFGVLVLGFDPAMTQAPQALLLTLASALTLAFATTLMRRMSGVGTFELQAWSALIGIPVLLLLSWWLEHDQLALIASARALDWSGVLYSALIASLVGHGLLYWLLQRHPVAQVTPYLLLAPVLAVALGVFAWGDKPGPKLWLGGAMVLVGVLIVALRAWVGRRQMVAADLP